MKNVLISLVVLLFLSSCSNVSENVTIKKFVLRFNAGHYNRATKYVSPLSRSDYAIFYENFCYKPYQPQINVLINEQVKDSSYVHFKFSFSNSPNELTSKLGT